MCFIHAEECDEIYYRLKGVTTVANMFTDDVIYIATDNNSANDCKDMLSKLGSGRRQNLKTEVKYLIRDISASI